MRLLVRAVGVVLLLAVLVGLCVHYGPAAAEKSPYPTTTELAQDYDSYVGEQTLVFGDVVSVDESSREATIRATTSEGPLQLRVTGFSETVQTGGVVQVYGTIESDRTIAASNVAVVNPAGSSKAYKYGVSAAGALLVLVVFFRHWQFDRDSLAFEVRADG